MPAYSNPLAKQQKLLSHHGLDALVAFSPDNVAYGAGMMIPSQVLGIRKRVFAVVVTPEKAGMMVASVEFNQAKANARIQDIRSYNEFQQDPMAVIADMLREFGAAGGRIGVEIDFLPGRHWESLQRHLPGARWVDAEKVFDHLRSVKTTEEIAALSSIGQVVNAAHRKAAESARTGWSEIQLGQTITEHILTHGGEGIKLLVVGAGERSVFPNAPPSQRQLRQGDVIRVDVFAYQNWYLSDIARTLVVGKANARQKEIWARLCEAQSLLISEIRPGASTRAIWERFLRYFEGAGLNPAINFVGHSLGLALHEEPFINRFSDAILEEGMVLAIEPLHFEGEWGFHLEDEVIITRDGCELISDGRGPLPELE